MLHVGSISLLDFQLEDPPFRDWLAKRAAQGLEVFVRTYTQTIPDPAAHAARLARLVIAHPFVSGWLPANEQNIEGWQSWPEIDAWNDALWWNVRWYRDNYQLRIPLLYPPFAQDAPLHHTEGWEACRRSIALYLDNSDGFAWHSYWRAGEGRLLEDEMPDWLRERLPHVPTLLHECGRVPDDPAGVEGLGNELLERFGSWAWTGVQPRSVARAVTPWLLSSRDAAFGPAAWVDEAGNFRQVLYDWAWYGP